MHMSSETIQILSQDTPAPSSWVMAANYAIIGAVLALMLAGHGAGGPVPVLPPDLMSVLG